MASVGHDCGLCLLEASAAPGHRNAAAPRPAPLLTCTQDPAQPAQQQRGVTQASSLASSSSCFCSGTTFPCPVALRQICSRLPRLQFLSQSPKNIVISQLLLTLPSRCACLAGESSCGAVCSAVVSRRKGFQSEVGLPYQCCWHPVPFQMQLGHLPLVSEVILGSPSVF